MANVEHSALTGSNLHEPKGITSASSGTVYVADGSTSGSWTTLGLSSLASVAKAFETQLFYGYDSKAGTNGGTFTSGAWRTRTINTASINEISGASLAANVITLPAGTYIAIARAPAYDVGSHQTRIASTGGGTIYLVGSTARTRGDGDPQTDSFVFGKFVLSGSTGIELQHICQTTRASDGLGSAGGFANGDIYAQVLFWKVA